MPPTYAARKSSSESTTSLGGVRYVSIQKWAKAKGFKVVWDGKSRDFIVTNDKWAKLEFSINSKKAVLNDKDIYLSSTIESSGATLFISELDIDKLIHPIFYPVSGRHKVRTIAIAAGHGGKDPGYQLNKHQEKTYTLLMAKALKDTLEDAGFKVVMTRSSDVFVDLDEQADIANRAGADLFITIHFNAALNDDPKGVETYCLTPEGATSTNGGRPVREAVGNRNDSLNMLLAYQVHKYLLRNSDFEDRGLRRANFMVLRNIKMPGVYVEGGFLSNRSDAAKITSATQRQKMARAITDGVLAYKRLVERK
jgi:N-acetylmuramoyl-L-alanine amidase